MKKHQIRRWLTSLLHRLTSAAQAIVQCLSRHPQKLGGNGLVSVGTFEGFRNQQVFSIF